MTLSLFQKHPLFSDWCRVLGYYFCLFIFTLLLLFFIWKNNVFPDCTQIDNARYLISSTIQAQASIIAIVITLSIFGIQLISNSYSARLSILFKKNPHIWIIILIYGISIFFGIFLLRYLPVGRENQLMGNQVSISNHTLITLGQYSINTELIISFFIFYCIFTFIGLIFYIYSIIKSTELPYLSEMIFREITYEDIDKNGQTYQTFLDLSKNSIINYDLFALKIVFDNFLNRLDILISNEKNYDKESESILKICDDIYRISKGTNTELIFGSIDTEILDYYVGIGSLLGKHFKFDTIKYPIEFIDLLINDHSIKDDVLFRTQGVKSLTKLCISCIQNHPHCEEIGPRSGQSNIEELLEPISTIPQMIVTIFNGGDNSSISYTKPMHFSNKEEKSGKKCSRNFNNEGNFSNPFVVCLEKICIECIKYGFKPDYPLDLFYKIIKNIIGNDPFQMSKIIDSYSNIFRSHAQRPLPYLWKSWDTHSKMIIYDQINRILNEYNKNDNYRVLPNPEDNLKIFDEFTNPNFKETVFKTIDEDNNVIDICFHLISLPLILFLSKLPGFEEDINNQVFWIEKSFDLILINLKNINDDKIIKKSLFDISINLGSINQEYVLNLIIKRIPSNFPTVDIKKLIEDIISELTRRKKVKEMKDAIPHTGTKLYEKPVYS